jgi:hypothetical protein
MRLNSVAVSFVKDMTCMTFAAMDRPARASILKYLRTWTPFDDCGRSYRDSPAAGGLPVTALNLNQLELKTRGCPRPRGRMKTLLGVSRSQSNSPSERSLHTTQCQHTKPTLVRVNASTLWQMVFLKSTIRPRTGEIALQHVLCVFVKLGSGPFKFEET